MRCLQTTLFKLLMLSVWPFVLLFCSPVWSQSGDADSSFDSTTEQFIEKKSQRGPVTSIIRLEPAKPLIGDSITLILEVLAEADVELLMPEFGQSLDRFSILDFVPQESIDDQGRVVAKHRYTLQPPMSGSQMIPPLMIEFVDRRAGKRPAPEGEDAYELLTERINFEVESLVPKGTAPDLRPPLRELAPRALTAKSVWPWLIALLVVLIVIAPFAWRRWQVMQVQARRRSAYDIAHARISALTGNPSPDDGEAVGAFFVELSDILRRYLEDRFQLHAPELTTEEFLDVAASSPDLSHDQKGFLQDFLSRADQVKFAGYVPDAETIKQALQAVDNFLEQTKQDAPLVEDEGLGVEQGMDSNPDIKAMESKQVTTGAGGG